MINLSTRQAASQYAPFLLRLVLGGIFLIHGLLKFTAMGATVAAFTHLGVLLPAFVAPIIAVLEALGGLGLILGVGSGTRIIALLLALEMTFAILLAKRHTGFVGGYEYELALLAGLLALVLSGPGRPALLREKEE